MEPTNELQDTSIICLATLAENWWIALLRGVAGVIFGVITFVVPDLSFVSLVWAFGAYVFADGVLTAISAVNRGGNNEHWWTILVEGIIEIAAAVVMIVWSRIATMALIYVIAGWALVTGGLEIAVAVRLRKILTIERLFALTGLVSIALGLMLVFSGGHGELALLTWIGRYALVFGVLRIILAYYLRTWVKPATGTTSM